MNDEEALKKLKNIGIYVDICNLRINALKARNNELTTQIKILEYGTKRLSKAFQRTNRELIALKRAPMYQKRRRGRNNEIYYTNRRHPRNKNIHDKH